MVEERPFRAAFDDLNSAILKLWAVALENPDVQRSGTEGSQS
jgi:hypothetical protein